jgi:hypothetical protein
MFGAVFVRDRAFHLFLTIQVKVIWHNSWILIRHALRHGDHDLRSGFRHGGSTSPATHLVVRMVYLQALRSLS